MTTTANFGLTARQIERMRERYYDTYSQANAAAYKRAQLLAEWREQVGSVVLQDLLRKVEGIGLTKREADNELELLAAYDRYKNNSLLWDALGARVVRIARITDSELRDAVKGRVERRSQWVGGYVSDSKLTAIINECDPEYFENNPGERAIKSARIDEHTEALAKERMSLIRGVQSALAALEEQDIDGRSFMPRSVLRIVDRHARTRSR